MLYIIYAESANYACYGQHFVVDATSIYNASEQVLHAAEDYFFEQDEDQLIEDGYDEEEGPFADIKSIQPFGPEHEYWKFYQDPTQDEFYIKVNL